jgi:hypothetical protein
MKLKPGVKFGSSAVAMAAMFTVVSSVYERNGADATMTSCNDGTHSAESFHYKDQAADWRTHDYNGDKRALRDEIKADLGADFDVILEDEGGDNEHIHTEYDPK